MNIKYYNCPAPEQFAPPKDIAPEFLSYIPNWQLMEELAVKFADYSNVLVIGHGGSVTSFLGLYEGLKEQATLKKAHFLSTIDPDYISELKNELSAEDTLVIAISKSGETVTQIEALLQFQDYPLLAITGSSGPLYEIARNLKATIVPHPPVGGRFTAFTEVALLPAMLCGLNVKAIFAEGREHHNKFLESNHAWQLASTFYQLENNGVTDVFMPIYSHYLFGLSNLIVQLCHESFGKNQKGQTYFAHEAPESQHHTNQRFFGGPKNIAGIFTSVKSSHAKIETTVSEDLQDIVLKNASLNNLDSISLSQALLYEKEGTLQDALVSGIPVVDIELPMRDSASVGELIAFWQMYAVYSSILREVNPFDQPQVENSKVISFQKRLHH